MNTDYKIFTIKLSDISSNNKIEKSVIKKGVYIWGYYYENEFIPLYVGKSRNIHERIIQHYCRYKGGEYQIKPNSNHKPSSLFNIIFFENSNEKAFKDNVIKHFVFRYLEIETEAERELVEKKVANIIGVENLITQVGKIEDAKINNGVNELLKNINLKKHKP